MRKTYSDAVILDVLARCEAERPEVPLEWIQAALSRTRADGAAPRQGSFFNNNRASERPFYEVFAEPSNTGATACLAPLAPPRTYAHSPTTSPDRPGVPYDNIVSLVYISMPLVSFTKKPK